VGEEREITGKLSELLASMKDWERRPIVKVGRVVVELIKLPRRESRRGVVPEKLALHVRLEDSFKGVFIEESGELEDVIAALQTKAVKDIARALDDINRRRVVEYSL